MGWSSKSRYSSSSLDTTTLKSSTDLKKPPTSQSAFKQPPKSSSSSDHLAAAVVVGPTHMNKNKNKNKLDPNLGSMVKKFITMSVGSGGRKVPKTTLVIPPDFIAHHHLKKEAKDSGFAAGLHNKLFNNNNNKAGKKKEALTEVKSNTRTLAMVLRSERELLALNKDQHSQIAHLNTMLLHHYSEVEKLKDLCLKQREEIRSLKNAVLFPDTMNLDVEELLEKQGSELMQAKQLIPSLQRQVTSLTGQLHCLAVDLAEVKADKHFTRNCSEAYVDSPKTPTYDQHDAIKSLEFSCEDQTTPGSPDDMFTKDFNPCLTPYSKTKSNEFHGLVYESPRIKSFSRSKLQLGHDIGFDPYLRKVSKSSDCCQCSNSGSSFARTGCRSDETKSTFGIQ